jgi:large subunit ribosomal protein L23
MELFPDKKKNKKAGAAKKASAKRAKAPQVTESPLAHALLRKPRITEKSYALGSRSQYVFEVAPHATKKGVAEAVAQVYGVSVVSVNIAKLPGKVKLFGRAQTLGRRKSIKKAIVTLAPGQSIELFNAGL